jgi:hypothetical protein
MFASPLARTLRVCVPLAAAAMLALAGTSYGGVDPTCNPDSGACAFSFDSGPYAISGPADPIDCLGPGAGTVTGTAQDSGGGNFSNIETNRFFHFHATHSEVGRLDFPYGHVLYRLRNEFNYSAGSHTATLTLSNPVNAQGTVYGTDGQPTGQAVSLHGLVHFTWIDTNGNGDPDPVDDYKASVDRFRVTCS